ncbi:hypothetical protein [Actinokineospora diospyrosa]|uniref:Tetratricopeptide repeat protein n=1 Tax=Actinokineospora diospyrosa TaxID=103728 RepID=A0ABT1IMU9_9PSEU|nr:hypothetical protein [Actinokineospora diospyrosa]MCP2273965.1 hypothetical protein [Actinokineospora diospyrosa]
MSTNHPRRQPRTAVAKAEDLFATSTPDDEPTWLVRYGQAHLDRDAGRALFFLALNGGGHEQAQRRLDAAITRFPEGHSRGKALAKADLAAPMMACGEPHEAVALGNDALASVGSVRSDRVNDALKRLAEAARGHRTVPEVRDLAQRVRRTLRSQTG